MVKGTLLLRTLASAGTFSREVALKAAEVYPKLTPFLWPLTQNDFDIIVAQGYRNILAAADQAGELRRFREWQSEEGTSEALDAFPKQVASLVVAGQLEMAETLLKFLDQECYHEKSDVVYALVDKGFSAVTPGVTAWLDCNGLSRYLTNEDPMLDAITKYLGSEAYDKETAGWLVKTVGFRAVGIDPKVPPSRVAYQRMFDLDVEGMCEEEPLSLALGWLSKKGRAEILPEGAPTEDAEIYEALEAVRFLVRKCRTPREAFGALARWYFSDQRDIDKLAAYLHVGAR